MVPGWICEYINEVTPLALTENLLDEQHYHQQKLEKPIIFFGHQNGGYNGRSFAPVITC
jgi:hypothetical protein